MGRGGTLTLSPPECLCRSLLEFGIALLYSSTLQGALYGKNQGFDESLNNLSLTDSLFGQTRRKSLLLRRTGRCLLTLFPCCVFVTCLSVLFGGTCVPERVRVISIARL